MTWLHNRLLRNYVLDPGERALSTFVQQFVIVLLTGGSSLIVTQHYLLAADSAGLAAVVSLLTSVLTFWVSVKPPLVDLALRVLKTFIQSFLGTLLASHVLSITGADWKGALAIAFPVAMTAALKGLAAFALPWSPGTASLLPGSSPLAIGGVSGYSFTAADFDYTDVPPLGEAGSWSGPGHAALQ